MRRGRERLIGAASLRVTYLSTMRLAAALLLALAGAGCKAPDPQALLQVKDVEAYWTVDPSRGSTNYLAPAVRFQVANRTDGAVRAVQATATFAVPSVGGR